MGSTGPYKSFCIPMDSNGSLLVIRGPFLSLWVLIGPDESLCVSMGLY